MLAVILAISVFARVGSSLYQGAGIEPLPGVTDQISYHELAIRVATGHGFTFGQDWWPATKANEPTAHWSFLYVLMLAGIYSLFGPSVLVARLLQAVVAGALHPWLTWRIANRLFGPRAGVFAAASSAVYGYFVYYGGALLTEPLYMVGFLWVLDRLTAIAHDRREGRRTGLGAWVLLGVSLAVTTLLRQVFLLVVPAMLLWLAWEVWRPGAKGAAPRLQLPALIGRGVIVVAIVIAAVLPWTMRNQRVFGHFVLLNTNAGFVLYWGNHPVHGTNFIPIMSTGEVNYMTLIPPALFRLNEAALDRELLRRGLGFIVADPGRFARLSASRAREYFKFWPSSDSGAVSNAIRVLSFGVLLPLILGGLFVTARWAGEGDKEVWTSGAALLLGVAAIYALVHLLTWTLVRYRLPVDAVLVPFAGVALSQLAE